MRGCDGWISVCPVPTGKRRKLTFAARDYRSARDQTRHFLADPITRPKSHQAQRLGAACRRATTLLGARVFREQHGEDPRVSAAS